MAKAVQESVGRFLKVPSTMKISRTLPVTEVSTVKTGSNAIQYGGDHYKGKRIEPWDYIVANGIGFLDGTAIKYLSRWKEKNGVEDLRKAKHYIEKLIEIETGKTNG